MRNMALKDLCIMKSGGTPSRKNPSFYEGEIPWAKISDLEFSPDGYIHDTKEHITQEALASINNRFFDAGTLFLAMYGSVGKTGISKIPMTTNQAILGINIKEKDLLDIDYLKYWFKTIKQRLLNRAVGAALPNISLTIVKELEIPLPPLDQQKKIAAILDAADAYRQKTKALITKYEELTQSLFLDMFGDPVSNIKGYFKSTVGEECDVKGGKRIPKGDKLIKEKTNHPYIKAQNIKNGFITEKNIEYLTDNLAEKLKRYIVKKGDVCITVVGVNIGDIGIVPETFHLANLTENANKILIKNKDKLDDTYLAYYMMSDFVQRQVIKRTMAVGVPKLALFRIQQISLLLPPIEMQRSFKTSLNSIKSQKTQAQASLVQAEDLFSSLLQRAFKGELV